MKPKLCFDRILPEDRFKSHRLISESGAGMLLATRLIAPVRKQWMNGTTLKVRFIGGGPVQHAIVKTEANWWSEFANIKFDFNDAPNADIRISFDENDGAWSYIGTECASIPLDQPTMNLGFLDPGTAAHEFGHAIGCSHEHQNPKGGIQWNEPVVINALKGSPNFWDEPTIRHNVLEKYSFNQVIGTDFDPKSIMLYFFPAEWTLNGVGTQANNKLSDLDKWFIGSPMMYPKPVTPCECQHPSLRAKVIIPNHKTRTRASIGHEGEEDLFKFTVEEPGRYTVDTRGKTNVAMRLFGPGSITHLIAEDDDSGIEDNAEIDADLLPGDYFIQVRHSDAAHGTGAYTIKVFKRDNC